MQRKKKGHKRKHKHTTHSDNEDGHKAYVKLENLVTQKCRKVRYVDALSAKLGMQQQQRTKLYVYECPKCKGYHLTRQKHSADHQRRILL